MGLQEFNSREQRRGATTGDRATTVATVLSPASNLCLRQVQTADISGSVGPISPADAIVPTMEPPDLEEFLSIIQVTFQAAPAACLDDLRKFTKVAGETVIQLSSRFDEVACPLLTAGLMTSRGLALHLRRHLRAYIRERTWNDMVREDRGRF